MMLLIVIATDHYILTIQISHIDCGLWPPDEALDSQRAQCSDFSFIVRFYIICYMVCMNTKPINKYCCCKLYWQPNNKYYVFLIKISSSWRWTPRQLFLPSPVVFICEDNKQSIAKCLLKKKITTTYNWVTPMCYSCSNRCFTHCLTNSHETWKTQVHYALLEQYLLTSCLAGMFWQVANVKVTSTEPPGCVVWFS